MTVALACLMALCTGSTPTPDSTYIVIESVSNAGATTFSLVYTGPTTEVEYRYELSVQREHRGNHSTSRQSGAFVPSGLRTVLATSTVNLTTEGHVLVEGRVWDAQGALLAETVLDAF